MLELVYTFRGRDYALDYDTLTMDEFIAAERATGMHWAQLAQGIEMGTAVALKAFLWLALRREQPNLSYSGLVYRPAEATLRYNTGEPPADPPGGEKTADPPASADSPNDP